MSTMFSDDNFESEVLKSDLPVMVDFYAEWCGPCKMMAPIIDELEKEYGGKWKIGKCNVDESPKMSEKYGIQSIPSVKIFKGGELVSESVGFQSKEALKSMLDA